jgi:chitodextrinase
MRPHVRLNAPLALFVAAALTLIFVVPAGARPLAQAATPPNDNFVEALTVDGFPSSHAFALAQASRENGEPESCVGVGHSVWYRLAPEVSTAIRVSVATDMYPPVAVDLFAGNSLESLTLLRCSSYLVSAFHLPGGATYYLRVSAPHALPESVFTVAFEQLALMPNDNFADAEPIAGLPFEAELSVEAASMEADEPLLPCHWDSAATVWFAFTAPESRFYGIRPTNGDLPAVGIYTGNTVSALTQVGAGCYWETAFFQATAGESYYVQIGSAMGSAWPISFVLDVAPPPSVSINTSIYDPSTLDEIGLEAWVSDPAYQQVVAWSWDFGDGTTSYEESPYHRYAADGDYTVRVEVTTADGRIGRGEIVLPVRTHDVAITKFTVPQSARAGQTRSITVGLNNPRDEVVVKVRLYKSDASYYDEFVGELIMLVPPRQANRTTNFAFSYTFTADDATLGKVTFKAYAEIQNGRDAAPADNQLIAPPTRVTR